MNARMNTKYRSFYVAALATVLVAGMVGCASVKTVGPTQDVPPDVEEGPDLPTQHRGEGERDMLEKIHFDFDKSDIRPDAAKILRRNAEIIKDNPSWDVRIEGHCDERGSDQYNQALGMRRAISTRDYLADLGVDKNRMSVISFGESQPIVPDARTAAQHQKNRRGEFVVIEARGQ